MPSQNQPLAAPKKSNLLRNAFYLVVAVIVLIGLYYHLQNPILVIGGAITVILAHLGIAGGIAHIVPALKKRVHGEPTEQNLSEDAH